MHERYRGVTLAGGRNPGRVPPTMMLRPFGRAGQERWILSDVQEIDTAAPGGWRRRILGRRIS
jgi:hypothetical protein